MRKRAILAGAIAAAVALVAAGCSSSGGSSGNASGSTITYWASNQGTSLDNDKQVLTPVLDDFTKKTGIKVKLEVIGWNDLQTRIQTAVTSGQGPDVLNIGNTWAASLQATGAFMPFDDAAMKSIGGSDKFVKTALETGGAPGKDRDERSALRPRIRALLQQGDVHRRGPHRRRPPGRSSSPTRRRSPRATSSASRSPRAATPRTRTSRSSTQPRTAPSSSTPRATRPSPRAERSTASSATST